MDDPFQPGVHARIRQAFLLGLARQPLTPPPSFAGMTAPGRDPALTLLALAGQHQRFSGGPQPTLDPIPEAAVRMHQDPRPILPQPARRALTRLAASVEKAHAPGVLSIAVRRVCESGCRAHPFDLPELARHIKADGDSLGLAERAYLALTAADGDEDAGKGLFFEQITLANWTTFPKAHRRTFVAGLRKTDPAAGRALIEGVWKTEPAPVRAAILEALAVGLGPDDKPFLDKLATDRADTVKRTAAQLLTRMPSTESFDARLAAAAKLFTRPRKGMFASVMNALGQGGDGLMFTPPTAGATWSDTQAVREQLFAGLPLPALAGAVGVSSDEIISALPVDEHVVLGLLLDTALADGDTVSARTIVGGRLLSSQASSGHFVVQLAAKARLALEPDVAAQLLAAAAWTNTVRSYAAPGQTATAAQKDDGRLVHMATLMPRAAMPAFVHSLAEAPLSATRAAKDFAELILALPDVPTAGRETAA